MTMDAQPGQRRTGDHAALLAARTALLTRRDSLYDDAIGTSAAAGRALIVARAEGIEEAAAMLEHMLSPSRAGS